MRVFGTPSWGVRTKTEPVAPEYWTEQPRPRGRRRPSLLVNVALALLAAGAVTWAFTLIRGTATTADATSSNARTVTVSQGTVTATVIAGGSLDVASTAGASFGTSGTVTAIYVKVGQTVTKDQLLARVDAAPAKRSLALAKANLAAANDALSRATSATSGTTPAENEVTKAALAVGDAQAQVDATNLTAPMAGTVVAVNGVVGGSSGGSSSATPSAAFIDLADLTALQVVAHFSETDATQLEAGQPATIIWSVLPGAEATGRVLAVDPQATTTDSAVTYGVTISLGKLPTGAKPGQTVTASVVTGTVRDATYVDPAAVTVAGTTSVVTVETAAGIREIRPVRVGLRGDDAYQITSGLAAGEKVLLPETATTGSNRRSGGP